MSTTSHGSLITKSPDEPYWIQRPQGYFEYQLPISVKAILIANGKVLLVGNPRGELELPGGKIEAGEDPLQCAEREVQEEVSLAVKVVRPVHAWVYEITPERHVFVIAYGAILLDSQAPIADAEVGTAEFVNLEAVEDVRMPQPYKDSIRMWANNLEAGSAGS